jgi:PAS domain S-box-containing protein
MHDAQEMFELIFKISPDAAVITRLTDGLIVNINDRFVDISGYTRDEALGKTSLELNLYDNAADRDKVVKIIQSLKTGFSENAEIVFRKKNGGKIIGIMSSQLLNLQNVPHIYSIIRDITDRKNAEEEQKQTASLLRATLESTTDGILVVDRSGKVTSFNRKFGELWRIPKLLLETRDDDTLLSFILDQLKDPGAFIAKVKELYAEPRKESFDTFEFKDGRVFERYSLPQCIEDEIVGRVWSFRDVTDRKKTESVLLNAQKLESLGVLAGGIAHDFNNLMCSIFSFIDLAKLESRDNKMTGYLSSAMSMIGRARGLTQQLLTFAKGGSPVKKITPLSPFIQDSAHFALSGSNVSCRFDVPETVWPCNVDRDQIGQVIDNIVINAVQAMPDGGTIDVSATNVILREKGHGSLPAGRYVKISVKDTGIGIPEKIVSRIFDPFYTTKTSGHGLGLATSHSIINRHNGAIDVESRQGTGSVFHVYLPASGESAVVNESAVSRHAGQGTFLVMDDQIGLRETFRLILESMGYTVICVNNGIDAVEIFMRETGSGRVISGMIFDLTIPGGMGGKEAVAKIRRLDPEIPVFAASGYSDDPVMTNPAEYGFSASICKPFAITELAEMLERHIKK